jgi:leucyl-tRNA synthetase
LILVAPWKLATESKTVSSQTWEPVDPNEYEWIKDLYNFNIDTSIKNRMEDWIYVYTSNDEQRLLDSANLYIDALAAKHITLENRWHFHGSLGEINQTFPELIELITSHKGDSSQPLRSAQNDEASHAHDSHAAKITVFTTRPDTLFGVTAIVMAPEIASIDANIPQEYSAGVEEYRKATSQKSEVERQQDAETKSWVFSGVYAIHPLTNEQVPIWFADYVLPDYATGAVMFVPAHDERDFDFAKKHGLPIIDVIAKHYISWNKPEPTKETTIRQNVLAMLYNQDKTKILCLDWITADRKSFIMGWVEENETFEEAGKREIMEESWYTNIEVLWTVRWEIHAEYFAAHKDINRYSKERCVVYHLLSEDNTGVREGEKDHHLVWMPVEEVKEFLAKTPGENNSNLIFFQRYLAENQAYTDEWILINSWPFDGMKNSDAKKAITAHLEKEWKGRMHISFKLRDASFSRQRYWGEPIPVEYDADGVAYPIDESELPLVLPVLDNFQWVAGKSPLSNAPDRVSHNGRTRETDTMPGYAGSSWYYLRYMDPTNADAFVSKDAINYWQNVDLYIGGTEHAVGHLMYSRFWHKFLYDIGHVSTTEPFKKLFNQWMIEGVIEYLYFRKAKQDGKTVFVSAALVNKDTKDEFSELPIHISYVRDYGMQSSYINQESIKWMIEWRPDFGNALFEHADGIYDPSKDASSKQEFRILTRSENGKMSKSYYNVINPDSVIWEYGADCFRMYEMFLWPVNQSKPWNMNGIDWVYKFLKKVWALCCDEHGLLKLDDVTPSPSELKIIHTCIKKVDNDIVNMSLNTCISNFMITVNGLKDVWCKNKQVIEMLLRVLAPFAPFITEELRSALWHTESIHNATYPAFDEKYLVEDSVTYPFCINGKRKTEIILPASMSVADIQKHVLTLDIAQKFIDGKPIKQLIVVPGRMINVVM